MHIDDALRPRPFEGFSNKITKSDIVGGDGSILGSISMSGTAVAVTGAVAGVNPSAVDFGAQPVNSKSVARSIILSNSGVKALNITAIATQAGHSSAAFTLDVYGHLMPGSDDELRSA